MTDTATMTKNVLEQLAGTNPDSEIWWDSSPLIFPSWRKETLAKAPEGHEADWDAQLTRMMDAETIAEDGVMGFRGVTTNPPLSLQAIKIDPAGWARRIKDIAKADPHLDVEGVYWAAYLDLVKLGAEAILPVYEKSGGKYGFLSGQSIRVSCATATRCWRRASPSSRRRRTSWSSCPARRKAMKCSRS